MGGLSINTLNLVDRGVRDIEAALRKKPNQIIIKYGGMSNGVAQMVSDVIETARSRAASISVLRIWSHGRPGGQGVTLGPPDVSPTGQRAGISLGNWDQVRPALEKLTPYLDRTGRVELRGCSVGSNDEGLSFLRALASLWKVDVHAALFEQNIGPVDWSGPVRRITPRGEVFPIGGLPIE
jgi:Domain of unknown function (DUF4347)